MAVEEGNVICKHCDFNVVWGKDLQIVDVEYEWAAVLVVPVRLPLSQWHRPDLLLVHF